VSYHAQLLREVFESKRSKNPRFSLRSFAKQIRVSPAQLSQLISGKRKLTPSQAIKIAESLQLLSTQRKAFFESVHSEMLSSKSNTPKVLYRELTPEEFASISDWYFYAILSLAETQESKSDAKWVSKRLGIPMNAASKALKKLELLGLVELTGNKLKIKSLPLSTAVDLPQTAVRKTLQQGLDLAKNKISTVDVSERDCSSMTMAINPEKIPEAKKLIREFRRELCALLESTPQTEVYQLGIQLVPLSKSLERPS